MKRITVIPQITKLTKFIVVHVISFINVGQNQNLLYHIFFAPLDQYHSWQHKVHSQCFFNSYWNGFSFWCWCWCCFFKSIHCTYQQKWWRCYKVLCCLICICSADKYLIQMFSDAICVVGSASCTILNMLKLLTLVMAWALKNGLKEAIVILLSWFQWCLFVCSFSIARIIVSSWRFHSIFISERRRL